MGFFVMHVFFETVIIAGSFRVSLITDWPVITGKMFRLFYEN